MCEEKKVHHLPIPEGQYVTGCIDIMDGYSPEDLFIRLYYPTDASSTKLKESSDRWIRWIPHDIYVEGFALFLNLWLFVLKFFMWLFGRDTYIPTLSEEPVSKKIKSMPVMIFSHGFGATRFLCSTFCNEIASRGCLVASIEHRDKSACLTYYYESEKDKNEDKKTYLLHSVLAVDSRDHYYTRNKQLKERSRECSRVMDFIEKLNKGDGKNILNSKFDINSFQGLLDLSSCIISGHSFGGATAMHVLSNDKRFKVGIVLDGWMFPLKDENLNLPQPVLFINTHTFHIKANLKILQKYTSQSNKILYTIKNTTHESNTDTAVIYGYWLNLMMKKLDATSALLLQNYLTINFLHKHLGMNIDEEKSKEYIKHHSEFLVQDVLLYSNRPRKKITLLW